MVVTIERIAFSGDTEMANKVIQKDKDKDELTLEEKLEMMKKQLEEMEGELVCPRCGKELMSE